MPTMLFVPGGDERKLAKVPGLDADAVILDLEDAVANSEKERARAAVADLLRAAPGGPARWVRVNAAGGDLFEDDVRAVAAAGAAGIVLPKAERPEQVARLDALLGDSPCRVLPTVESAAGLRAAERIAAASPRVVSLAFGAADFSLDMGIDWLDAANPLLTAARVELALACRAAGVDAPHDGAFPRHRDLDGLREQAEFARSIGFGTKHAIHPAQVPVIRTAFAPTPGEVERAERICREFEAAEADGRAAVSVDGTLVDYPVWQRARRVLRAAGVGS